MDLLNWKHLKSFFLSSATCRCVTLALAVLAFRAVLLSFSTGFSNVEFNNSVSMPFQPASEFVTSKEKFLEVPQLVWGLNNQKIAFARACLTAKMLNRTLLMPSLSASLFYKEIHRSHPISFDKVFQFEKFNSLCTGFVRMGRNSDITNRTKAVELQKGSGRRWTAERDLDQLRKFSRSPFDGSEVIHITGKNPFLWPDHWPVKDYGRVFECLVLVDELANKADRVVSSITAMAADLKGKNGPLPYVAVHMRIEKDWMIHCKKLEQRSNITQICSSKAEIMERVGNIAGLVTPIPVYLAVADSLLEDSSILDGWKEGLVPLEKKRLGVDRIYNNYPYLIQAAIDYEVCLRADFFVGNSFSTFSSLIVLERTQKMVKMGVSVSCEMDSSFGSYAYNILGEFKGPQRWVTDMSGSSLHAISYGSNNISC